MKEIPCFNITNLKAETFFPLAPDTKFFIKVEWMTKAFSVRVTLHTIRGEDGWQHQFPNPKVVTSPHIGALVLTLKNQNIENLTLTEDDLIHVEAELASNAHVYLSSSGIFSLLIELVLDSPSNYTGTTKVDCLEFKKFQK